MSQDSEITTMSGCLARVTWFALGPALLFLCAVIIAASQQNYIPSVLDIIYAGLLVIIIIARLVDRPPKPEKIPGNQVVNKQETEEYQSSSAVRYIIILSVVSIVLWLVAHFVMKQVL